jgi:hypothetical protein
VELSDLSISEDLRSQLRRACEQFDTSLDWNNPSGPSPWTADEMRQFNRLADRLLADLRSALRSEFEIRDERDGGE